jgi:predicted dehydrogenase
MKLPDPPVRLTAVCEPELASHAEAAAELRAMGLSVFTSLRQMLKSPIDAVWLQGNRL